jgi:Na+/H+-dicarboxylate symporter
MTILAVLRSINLDITDIGILYTVEWLLDRVRTSVNVYSHNLNTIILNKIVHKNDGNKIVATSRRYITKSLLEKNETDFSNSTSEIVL